MIPEEINRIIAEKVMGWTGPISLGDELRLYFDPYHRIEHAHMAVEKFKTWEFGKNEDPKPYYCVIDFDKAIGCASTPSEAISLAIVEAIGGKE